MDELKWTGFYHLDIRFKVSINNHPLKPSGIIKRCSFKNTLLICGCGLIGILVIQISFVGTNLDFVLY